MKKLIALVCALVMLCSVAATAFAKLSPGALKPKVEVVISEEATEEEVQALEEVEKVAEVAAVEEGWNDNVKAAVAFVNNLVTAAAEQTEEGAEEGTAEGTEEGEEAVPELEVKEGQTLLQAVVENLTLSEDSDNNYNSGDLASGFSSISYDENVLGSVEVELTYEQLATKQSDEAATTEEGTTGEATEEEAEEEINIEDYCILLINPVTGEYVYLDLKVEDFDAKTGKLKVSFPFPGIFALVKKAA